MGLFRRKKKITSPAIGASTSGSFGEEPTTTKKPAKKSSLFKKKSKKKQPANNNNPNNSLTSNDDDEISSVDLGDIPRSISTTSPVTAANTSDGFILPPPTPITPNREMRDEDSIGSPCEAMRRLNQQNNSSSDDVIASEDGKEQREGAALTTHAQLHTSTKKLAAKLSNQSAPSIHSLPEYIAALTEEHSPNTSADLPSRALRALFALSERKESHEARVAMVRDGHSDDTHPEVAAKAGILIPTLLTFLQRCPKDSSEQYLTLLVLNNLSIPMENKALVALECGAVHVLSRMLLEDVGCHLLVIVIVNLTFCDVEVRKRLLLGDYDGESGDGDVQLVDCLAYALMLSSITTEQLSTLGPIPLNSPNGKPHTPHQLLSILRSTLTTTFPNFINNNDDHNNISPPLLLSDDDGNSPFPETARWCLCALKNLTRPGKLSSNYYAAKGARETCIKITVSTSGKLSSSSANENELLSGDAIAARAIIDAGLVPILLRVIRVAKKADGAIEFGSNGAAEGDPFVGRLPDEICNEGCVALPNLMNVPTWKSNSAQDAALYTLMHMTSISSVRDDLLRKNSSVGGGSLIVEELKNIVDCGLDGVGVGDKLLDVVTGDGLVADVDNDDGLGVPMASDATKNSDLGWLALHCIKARMSLSFLFSTGKLNEKYDCSSYILVAEHEAHSLVELLSHCLENRSREGPGGYSAATFTLKGVLHSIRCLLAVEPGNRSKFASINGARLNALLLKVAARYALLSGDGDNASFDDAIDNKAVDDAVVSLYYMSQVGFQESVCMSSPDQSAFLPSTFGKRSKSGSTSSLANCDAKDIVVKVLTVYIGKIDASSSTFGRYAAIQLMLRASLLRFEGEVANLTYPGKRYPSRMDFDFDNQLLAAADALLIEKETEGVRPKPILFGRRRIARYERYGSDKPKVYANPIIAAEDIAFIRMIGHFKEATDDIAIANDITSCAEGVEPSGESHGFIWKWEDGGRVLDKDSQSVVRDKRDTSHEFFAGAGEKVAVEGNGSSATGTRHRGLLDRLGNLVAATNEDEPVSIFGFKCAAPKCGRNTAI